MKRKSKNLFVMFMILLALFSFVSCAPGTAQAIELMGAVDRIHDSYTFANIGVKIKKTAEEVYTIYGSVERFENARAKQEFSIDEDVTHIVAIKLTAVDCDVSQNEVEIMINGVRSYDAEHLNGSDYTFIIFEAVPGSSVTINVKWCSNNQKNYVVKFDESLILK